MIECQACWNNRRRKRTKQKTSKTVDSVYHGSEKQNGGQHGGRGRRHGRQHPGLESDKVDPQLDVTGTSNQLGVGKILMRKDPKDQTWKIAPKNVDLTAERLENERPYLPTFKKVEAIPLVTWASHTGEEFYREINDVYETMVHWQKNLLMIPSEKAGKEFITELSSWLNKFNNDTPLQSIVLKVYMVLPSFLIQKPSRKSKAKQHSAKLSQRLTLWKEGKIDILLREGKAIQRQLQRKPRSKEEITKIFSRLMLQGKVTAALKFLESEAQAGGILPLNDETLQGLYEKHPPPKDIKPFSLLYGPIDDVPSTYFESIDEELIQKAAIATHGTAGPSKLDADQYQRMLCSRNFKTEGLVLRNEIATLAKKLVTENLDPIAIESYNANRLIPLDKCPGIRPIGVGEILRRIIGKSISRTLKKDIQEAVGPLQTCSGLNSGGEAAIHAMKEIFDEEETDGVILVDASNAFNNMNRLVALHNIRVICPAISTILINMYRTPTRLFIAGGEEILSREGTTQGDNLAMPFYALGTSILIYSNNNAKQIWLADDAAAGGSLKQLRTWWDNLICEGDKFEYFVNQKKSWLILKDPKNIQIAKDLFNSSINVTTGGKRHLGASLGTDEFTTQYMNDKVSSWLIQLENLNKIAESNPQVAYSAYINGFQHKFTYFMRTIPNISSHLQPIEDFLANTFLPTLFGTMITKTDRDLYSLPTRLGGLGISVLPEIAEDHYKNSKRIVNSTTCYNNNIAIGRTK